MVYLKWCLNLARVCVSKGDGATVQPRACRGSPGWLQPIPHFPSSSLFRKSHYRGRPSQTGGVSQVNICLEEGVGGRGGEGAVASVQKTEPAGWVQVCSDGPVSVGAE